MVEVPTNVNFALKLEKAQKKSYVISLLFMKRKRNTPAKLARSNLVIYQVRRGIKDQEYVLENQKIHSMMFVMSSSR